MLNLTLIKLRQTASKEQINLNRKFRREKICERLRAPANGAKNGQSLLLAAKVVRICVRLRDEKMKHFGLFFVFLLLLAPIFGQSTNQDFPSPIVRELINGKIAARDIGDARLTRHFYTFYAGVGDLFLNVETANFNGDIDLFEATTLRPISKISIYATDAAATTSRIVYFRQRTQVVMRVEGRTPNDEAASYRINFSGSFAAATDLPQPPEDAEPKVSEKPGADTVARVNSAGAIIEVLTAKKQPETPATEPEKPAPEPEKPAEEKAAETTTATTRRPSRTGRTTPARRTPRSRRTTQPQPEETAPAATETNTAETTPETSVSSRPAARKPRATRRNSRNQPAGTETTEPKVDPLANVRLVVLLKDGYKIERPMSEVLRASVDKGTLVVITKDGKIERFAILDVLKFSIEQ